MNRTSGRLDFAACMDSDEIAGEHQRALDISRRTARELGRSAVSISKSGSYRNRAGDQVDLKQLVDDAVANKVSIPPEQSLPLSAGEAFDETAVQVTNETTLIAAQRLTQSGLEPLALNFANGVNPGGGFLSGSRAQEEVLCRSSGLYLTLLDDPMYEHHREREQPDSTDWSIYSPQVPVFRTDSGTELDRPWLLSFLTCAAPYAPTIGQPLSGDLLERRIHRVLAIGRHSVNRRTGNWVDLSPRIMRPRCAVASHGTPALFPTPHSHILQPPRRRSTLVSNPKRNKS